MSEHLHPIVTCPVASRTLALRSHERQYDPIAGERSSKVSAIRVSDTVELD